MKYILKFVFGIFLLFNISICYTQVVGTPIIILKTSAKVASINCSSPVNTGSLVDGLTVSTTNTSTITYSGANGRGYSSQTISSTGITGLTATTDAGVLSNGNGSITYTITGTPSGTGTANFEIKMGGLSCTLSRTVNAGSIGSLSCGSPTLDGRIIVGKTVNSTVTSTISYTGGNGGSYPTQTINSTSVTGLTATIQAGNFNVDSGNLVYTITGTPAAVGSANFNINLGGKTCIMTVTVSSATVNSIDCMGAVVSNILKKSINTMGNTITIPYTGGDGGVVAQTVSSTGVTGITATLTATALNEGNGNLIYNLSGIPSNYGVASFNINFGGKSCTLQVSIAGTSPVFNCGGVVSTVSPAIGSSLNVLSNGTTFTGTYTIPYVGGDGTTAYGTTSQTKNGITFTRVAGTYAVNAGVIVYQVSGNLTDNSSPTSFTIEGCSVSWKVTFTLPAKSWSGCNAGSQGFTDVFQTDFQDIGPTFNLSASNVRIFYTNANITAKGTVISGNPTKELGGIAIFKLVNIATGVEYLLTGDATTTVIFQSCQNWNTGNHSANATLSGNSNYQTLPAGTYKIQVSGISKFAGCNSSSSDSWAGCAPDLSYGTKLTVDPM